MATRDRPSVTERLTAPIDLALGVAAAAARGVLVVVAALLLVAAVGLVPVGAGTLFVALAVVLAAAVPAVVAYLVVWTWLGPFGSEGE